MSVMNLPKNVELPFFAYGVFKPSQLAYHRLEELVGEIKPDSIAGKLKERDGLPLIDPNCKNNKVCGDILIFKEGLGREAYKRIIELEPDKHYRWDTTTSNGMTVNVLYGKSPNKGSINFEGNNWDGRNDPLFISALDVVEEILEANKQFEWDLKPLFRLQMAYLLLWSSIERYVSLKYHLGDKVKKKVDCISNEEAFIKALKKHVKETRDIYRADKPTDGYKLDSKNPKKSLDYYYQVRSNITHRGKAVVRDFEVVNKSLSELIKIFRDVLDKGFSENSDATKSSL